MLGRRFVEKYPKHCARCNKYYPSVYKECTICKAPLDETEPDFIEKYPKYCVKCNKYYPGAWEECTICKGALVEAEQGYISEWRNRIVHWFIVVLIIGAMIWGVSVMNKHGILTKVHKQIAATTPAKIVEVVPSQKIVRLGEEEITDYIKANARDLVELKNGEIIFGKITGETTTHIFIKEIIDNEEQIISRDKIKQIRKPTSKDLQYVADRLTTADIRIREESISRGEGVRTKKGLDPAQEKYKREVESAKKAKRELERKLARTYVADGMTEAEVMGLWGQPTKKTSREEGGYILNFWYYPKHGWVAFRGNEVIDHPGHERRRYMP